MNNNYIWYINPKTGERKWLPESLKESFKKRQGLVPEEIMRDAGEEIEKVNIPIETKVENGNVEFKVGHEMPIDKPNDFSESPIPNESDNGKEETVTEKKKPGRKPKSQLA